NYAVVVSDLQPGALDEIEMRVKLALNALPVGEADEVARNGYSLARDETPGHLQLDELNPRRKHSHPAGEIELNRGNAGQVLFDLCDAAGRDGVQTDHPVAVAILTETQIPDDLRGRRSKLDSIRVTGIC